MRPCFANPTSGSRGRNCGFASRRRGVDWDHSRPSFKPEEDDYTLLTSWYGWVVSRVGVEIEKWRMLPVGSPTTNRPSGKSAAWRLDCPPAKRAISLFPHPQI